MPDANPSSPDPATGDEKALLLAKLRRIQEDLLWKLEGLSDADLRRPMTTTGTNLIGIVKHLIWITSGYLCSAFGRERETVPWEFDEESLYGLDMWATPDESTEEIIAAYRRACDTAAQAIDELDLDTTGQHHSGMTVSLRWMILNVLGDTTRHAGHADVVRELIDGSVGRRPDDPLVSDDEEYSRMYLARMTGDLDREGWMAYIRSRPDYNPSAWATYRRRVSDLWHSKPPNSNR